LGVNRLSHVATDAEINLMRKSGLTSPIEIEPGIVYSPIGGGITTAKSSIEVGMELAKFSRLIPALQKIVEDNLQEIGKTVSQKTGKIENDLKLNLEIDGNDYYAVEQIFGITIYLGKY